MPPTKQELSLLINPLVPESVQHNNRVLTSLHSLISFLLGLTAGILSLQSTKGFAFYLLGTVLVSGLLHLVLLYRSSGQGAGRYFPGSTPGEIEGLQIHELTKGKGEGKRWVVLDGGNGLRKGAWRNVWFGGGVLGEALSGFVLGWAGVGGILR